MKSMTLIAVAAATACSIAFTSYLVAGPHSGHGHLSGPGFGSDNNPGLFGRTAKDERNGFFNSQNNPGIQGSTFGRAAAAQGSANRVNPVPSATPSRGISPIPSATPAAGALTAIPNAATGGPFAAPSATPSQGITPLPSATPGGVHPPSPLPTIPPYSSGGISPIPSATPGGVHAPSPLPTIPPHPTGGISPLPSATPSRGINPVPSATPGRP
jgi:hypothetical protein